jgi:hypothetical protein
MFITTLLNKIFNADQTPNNTVSWSGTNGLKFIQDDIVEEIRARGCIVVPTVADLNSQGKSNSQNVIVQGIGVYTWFPTGNGPANGSNVVMANDGGFWKLQAVGNFFPNVGTDLAAPTGGVNVYAKAGVLKISSDILVAGNLDTTGYLHLPDIATPAQPTNGIILFSQGSVLKYRDTSGTVHTL